MTTSRPQDDTSTSKDTTGQDGLSTGVIIGVAVAAGVLTIAVVILIIICCVHRRRRSSQNRPGSKEMPSPGDVNESIRNACDDASRPQQPVHRPRAPAPAPSQPEPPKDNAVKNINLKSDSDYVNFPKPRVMPGSGKEVPSYREPMENSIEIPPVPSSRTQPTATGRSSLKDDHVDIPHTKPSRMHATLPPLDPPSDSSLPPPPPKDNAVKNINLKSDRDYVNIPKPRVVSVSGKEVPPYREPMENSIEIPPVPTSRTQPTATGRSSLKDDHVDHSHTKPSRMHATSPPLDPPSDSSLPPPPQPHTAAVHRYVNERKPSLPAVKPLHEYDISDFDTHSLDGFCSLDSLPSQPAPPPPNMSAIISNTASHGTTPHGDYFPMIPEELVDTSSVDNCPSLNSLPSVEPPPPPNVGGKDSRFPSQPPNMFSPTPVVASPPGHDPSAMISNTASHGTTPHGDYSPMIPEDHMDTSSFDNYPSLSSMPSVEPPPPPTVEGKDLGFLAPVPLDPRGGRQTTHSYINQGYDPESKLNTQPAKEDWYMDMRVKAKH